MRKKSGSNQVIINEAEDHANNRKKSNEQLYERQK